VQGCLCDASLPAPLLVEEGELTRGDFLGEKPVEGPEKAVQGVLEVSLESWWWREVVLGGQGWQEGQMMEQGLQRGERRERVC
jgi:hypothetical protein